MKQADFLSERKWFCKYGSLYIPIFGHLWFSVFQVVFLTPLLAFDTTYYLGFLASKLIDQKWCYNIQRLSLWQRLKTPSRQVCPVRLWKISRACPGRWPTSSDNNSTFHVIFSKVLLHRGWKSLFHIPSCVFVIVKKSLQYDTSVKDINSFCYISS